MIRMLRKAVYVVRLCVRAPCVMEGDQKWGEGKAALYVVFLSRPSRTSSCPWGGGPLARAIRKVRCSTLSSKREDVEPGKSHEVEVLLVGTYSVSGSDGA